MLMGVAEWVNEATVDSTVVLKWRRDRSVAKTDRLHLLKFG